MTHLIPENAKTKHIAALGATGSGKTSAIKVGLVEPLLANRERVLILDPTGAWWGLRLNADGKKNGFPIYIFGGDHGDYPLRAKDAGVLADTFGGSSDSAVFDMSLMTVSERTAFFTEFAEATRRKNRGPLHLIIDEAHLFMPQAGASSGGAVPAMLHAGNNLVSLGRSRGLRITLISQRPAKLHKDSLTQVQSIIAMRLVAPQDRKAIADWIADQADPVRGKEIIASLPTLKPGEAWIWSPQDDVLARVRFPLPKTYDSSKAPTEADPKALNLAPVDLTALQGKLTKLEQERKANDPAAMRMTIAALEAKLVAQPGVSADDIERAKSEGFLAGRDGAYSEGYNAGFKHAATHAATAAANAREIVAIVESLTKQATEIQPQSAPPLNIVVPARSAIVHHKDGAKRTFPIPPRNDTPHIRQRQELTRVQIQRAQATAFSGHEPVPLPKGERAVLIAAAQHPNGVTRQQLTILTGYKRSSRDAYIQRLREREYVETSDRITATESGIAALGDAFEPLPTGAALRQHVLGTLPEGERKVLEILIDSYPEHVHREEIDNQTGYKRSSRDAYLQRLTARELVETAPGRAKASADLFD